MADSPRYRKELQPSDAHPASRVHVPGKTIGRLSRYRRLLREIPLKTPNTVYSHELARLAGSTAAQVRRDLMAIGISGSTARGYDVELLVDQIGRLLDAPAGQAAALVGVGNLGRAVLAYFARRRPRLVIQAGFDSDPEKIDRVIHGCRCHPIERLPEIVRELGISVGIVTVPAAEAQRVADLLVEAGVRGILNFAPVPIEVPHLVYVEELDITTALERVAYFARARPRKGRRVGQ